MRANVWLTGLAFLVFLTPVMAAEKDKLDPANLVGTWTYVSGEKEGKAIPAADLKDYTVEITKDTITLKGGGDTYKVKYKLDASKTPCQISMEITEGPQGAAGSKSEGIIALSGDELKLCYPPMGGTAPKEFATKEGSGHQLFVLKKKK
jgi:uncharacterized protein (TIGR03067 family)